MTLSVRVRMYRLNELGDCFLVSCKDGDKTSSMLVDCGSFPGVATPPNGAGAEQLAVKFPLAGVVDTHALP